MTGLGHCCRGQRLDALRLSATAGGDRQTGDHPRSDYSEAPSLILVRASWHMDFVLQCLKVRLFSEILRCVDILAPSSLLRVRYIDDIFTFSI